MLVILLVVLFIVNMGAQPMVFLMNATPSFAKQKSLQKKIFLRNLLEKYEI